MQTPPEWIQFIPVVTALIAIVAALVTWQQMRIARTKLNHDLYDRRYKLFDAVRTFVSTIVVNDGASTTESKKYILSIGDAVFLFDESIVVYVKEIEEKAGIINVSNETLLSLSSGPARLDVETNRNEALSWMNSQSTGMIDKFKPFLSLDQRRRFFLGPRRR